MKKRWTRVYAPISRTRLKTTQRVTAKAWTMKTAELGFLHTAPPSAQGQHFKHPITTLLPVKYHTSCQMKGGLVGFMDSSGKVRSELRTTHSVI